MNSIYLDYAAHTPISKNARKAMLVALKSRTANNQSSHTLAQNILKQITADFERVKQLVHARAEHKVHVSGGGTEANRNVLTACAQISTRKVFAYSSIEHSSIQKIAKGFFDQGWEVIELPVKESGVLDLEASEAICAGKKPGIVSLMLVNNEIGTIQPVSQFFRILRNEIPDIILHTDASQAPLYLSVDIQRLGAHALTLCSQKIYGPQGIGLAVTESAIYEQMQHNGTLPHALIRGCTVALGDASKNRNSYVERMNNLQKYLHKQLDEQKIVFTENGTKSLPLAINLSFLDIQYDSEYIVSFLNTKNIYISSKSACLGSSTKDSYVLESIKNESINSLRISFGENTTKKDIKILVSHLRTLQYDGIS